VPDATRPSAAAKARADGKAAPASAAKDGRGNGRAKSSATSTASRKPKTPAKQYLTSGRPDATLPAEIGEAAAELEAALAMPVWLLIQSGHGVILDERALQTFIRGREELVKDGPVVLLVDSPGGYAEVAYKIARTLCRHAGGFTAVVPRYAKSAATLLTLGATAVLMGPDAELGPLDAQIYDEEREESGSALDEIQALEQLHSVALEQLHQTMLLMRLGTRKRSEVILPHACKLVSDMMAPLLDKIDTVHYAKQSRRLKVAEEYAVRLMVRSYGRDDAREAADKLVNRYPEHTFVIDREEAKSFVNVIDSSADVARAMRRIETYLWGNDLSAVGRLKERA
jgi:hypothetical protein